MTRRGLRLALAAMAILLVLILPDRFGLAWPDLAAGLAELVVVLALLCLAGRWAALVLVPLLSVLAVLRLADLIMRAALGRVFNPVTDLPLLDAGMRLLAGTLGGLGAFALACLVLLLLAGMVLGLTRATRLWAAQGWSRRQRTGAAAICALALLALAMPPRFASGNAAYLAARFDLTRQSAQELRRLRNAATRDAFLSREGMLAAIDRNILLIFVESYGRGSFENPLYAPHVATLRRAEAGLQRAGLAMRSGFLSAPIQGGQSWLAHATVANGLRIADQVTYRAALASGRQSLFHHARRMGFTTAAVMPGITRPWPEADAMGFDHVLAAADLDYRGKPFNWVTMPDQFTLAAMDRLLPQVGVRPRMLVQVALISSHAPWTPVPRLLPWDRIGDGSEFNAMAEAGDPPEIVWRDRERVRRSYRDALDYALQTVTDYARLHAAAAPLILILGDHQAAPSIAMEGGQDVPLHVIGPEALVARTRAWGLQPGLIPPGNATALPMESLRDLILGSFDAAPATCPRAEQITAEIC